MAAGKERGSFLASLRTPAVANLAVLLQVRGFQGRQLLGGGNPVNITVNEVAVNASESSVSCSSGGGSGSVGVAAGTPVLFSLEVRGSDGALLGGASLLQVFSATSVNSPTRPEVTLT